MSGNVNTQGELETPPRAWGRLGYDDVVAIDVGNTPTGVGKTWPFISSLVAY